MSKAACKCKPTECEECPEWIFTFADLVMLMMGFFVILWVLKPSPSKHTGDINNDEWIKTVASIREAFGYMPDPTSKDPVDLQMLLKNLAQIKPPKGPGDGGKTNLERKGPEGTDPEVTSIRKGKQSVVGGKLLFDAGDATLSTEVKNGLDQIVLQIRGHRNIVLVKGHTSLDDATDSATPEQKMDLSLRRAQAVADYLTSHGVEPDMLRVQGCSTFEPVIQRQYNNDTQSQNRRVEVEVTYNLVPEMQDTPAANTLEAHSPK